MDGNTCMDELPLDELEHHVLPPRGLARGFPGLFPSTVSSGASGFSSGLASQGQKLQVPQKAWTQPSQDFLSSIFY